MLWTSSLFKTDSSGCRGQVSPTTIPSRPPPPHFFLSLFFHSFLFHSYSSPPSLFLYLSLQECSAGHLHSFSPPWSCCALNRKHKGRSIRQQTRRNKQEDFSRKLCCKENHGNSSTNQVVFLLSFATLSLNFAKVYTLPS
jgi:hypothetical protein